MPVNMQYMDPKGVGVSLRAGGSFMVTPPPPAQSFLLGELKLRFFFQEHMFLLRVVLPPLAWDVASFCAKMQKIFISAFGAGKNWDFDQSDPNIVRALVSGIDFFLCLLQLPLLSDALSMLNKSRL